MNAVHPAYILALMAVFALLVLGAVCWCAERRFHPLADGLHRFLGLPKFARFLVACFVLGFVVYGSTKEDGDDTNSPPSRMSAPRRVENGQWEMESGVTAEDIARGWRVVTSAEAEPIAEMPVGAVTNDLLLRRGGYDWAFRVEPEGWRFPYRDGALDGVTVFARGEVRPDVGTLYFPVPLTNGVSLLPEVRWGLLDHAETQSRREVSVFSHAVTTNGSLLLDWRNALVGRDVNSPTNLQMELFSDGSFAWRTDGGSTSYLPVFPFDYDGDGLENSVDPEPLVANPIDVHGTTVEWYRIVCSNVFEVTGTTGVPPVDNDSTDTGTTGILPVDGGSVSTGTTGILPVDGGSVQFKTNVNSRAYYFVDVVASSGPAPIYFNADRDSRLGSPIVVARAGETNHVPLLIGVEYTVTSTVPISVSVPDAMYATVTTNDERSVTVKWPLEFSYSVSGGSYVVSVEPYDPGGLIEWERTSLLDPFNISGRARLLSSPSPSGCGFTTGDRSLTFTCANCSCSGCTVSGVFCVEEACHGLGSFCCGCVYEPHGDDEPGENPSPPADPDPPSVSVRFTQPVVIFEDAYANTYNQTVDKQSTSTTVSIEAYGGSDGGVVVVSMTNVDKLECTSGPSLPTSFMVDPYSRRAISVVYQGNRASGSADDIVVTAQMPGTSSSESATAVKVEVRKEWDAPMNDCLNRHQFGVSEPFTINRTPDCVGLLWVMAEELTNSMGNAAEITLKSFVNPLERPVTLKAGTVEYTPNISIIEPEDIVVGEIEIVSNAYMRGEAGASVKFHLHVSPFSVSFRGLSVVEIPCDDGVLNGYFADNFPSYTSHTTEWGAGRWIGVEDNNHVGGETTKDELNTTLCPQPYYGGTWQWDIPIGWKPKAWPSNAQHHKQFETLYSLFNTITDQGTVSIRKFNHTYIRTTNSVHVLDGVILP